MRIISYNILKNGNGREHLIAEVLQNVTPDIAILEEAADPQVVSTIARLADFPYYGSRKGYSVAFLSQAPPQVVEWHDTSASRTPFLEILTGNNVRLYGAHLYATLFNYAERLRVREIEALTSLTAPSRQELHLLIGDFNTIAPGDTIHTASMPFWLRWLIRMNGGNVKRDAIDTLLKAGYVDAFRHLHPDDVGYTLPTPSPNSRLDYAFLPRQNLDHLRECRVVSEPASVRHASDHYPILVEIATPD
jgi:exodeoxyribonuclease III